MQARCVTRHHFFEKWHQRLIHSKPAYKKPPEKNGMVENGLGGSSDTNMARASKTEIADFTKFIAIYTQQFEQLKPTGFQTPN